MAVVATEIQSLNEINYKSKIKIILMIPLVFFLFVFAFLSFYPVGDKVKGLIKGAFKGQGCNPDFRSISMEWIMPKIVVADLTIPASCMDRAGAPLKFSYLTINYHLISFAPFGLPFRVDTSFEGQEISLYFVQGITGQTIRLKDQTLDLARLQPIMGDSVKLAGKVTVDMSVGMTKQAIRELNLKAQSKNFQIPPQSIQGFTTPPLKVNEFYLEANTENHPRIKVEKLILGDTDSPMRANFKGTIDLQEGNTSMSPINLTGEIAFSDNFRQALPLIDMMFQSFNQKDGFYQIKMGGTLGQPKPMSP